MVLAVAFIVNIYSFLVKRIAKAKEVLFLTTLILSFLFFNTADPFLGIPIYIYFALLSILINLFSLTRTKQFNKLAIVFLLLNIVMLVQICNLRIGIFNPVSLLINKSNTDTLNIAQEMFVPTIDFTVIKHFVFFDIYLVFALFNFELIKKPSILFKLKKLVYLTIIILFVTIYLEFFIANFINYDYLDIIPKIIGFDDNVKRTGFFDFYVVHGWLSEPSSIIVTFPFFFVLAEKGLFNLKNLLLFIFGFIGVSMTGSTTGILMVFACFLYAYLRIILKGVKIQIIISTCVILALGVVSVFLFKDQLIKVISFLGFGESAGEFGSSTFRSESIVLAINSFAKAPLLGVGIGTVYCHSMVFQVLANIGLIGTFLSLYYHKLLFKHYRFSISKLTIIFILFLGSEMIQTFTSPYMLVVIVYCLKSKGLSIFMKPHTKLKLVKKTIVK